MLSLILILIAALFFTGIIIRTKSIFSGRKGPGIFQPIKDVVRLLKKGSVYQEVSTVIYKVAPVIYLASVVSAILCVPFAGRPGLLSFQCDFVFFAYILALGKFFCILAAMDTGSAFEGMGAAREALFSMLAEPAFFLILGTLSLLSGHTNFTDIFASLDISTGLGLSIAMLSAVLLLVISLIENSRLPIDDPKTHLELTMIHEVMILDNSGFDLALIHIAGYLKFAMYSALIANLFMTLTDSLGLQIAIFAAVQILSAFLTGFIESFNARFRMSQNPEFIFSLTAIAFLMIFALLVF